MSHLPGGLEVVTASKSRLYALVQEMLITMNEVDGDQERKVMKAVYRVRCEIDYEGNGFCLRA